MQLHVEGLEPAQYRQANASGSDRANFHAFHVVRACDAIGNVPTAFHDPLIGWNVVSYQPQDHHDHMLGHADAVTESNFGNRDAVLDGGLKIDMIRTDPRRNGQLQLWRSSLR